ncbi:MAG: ADOP family duplicated permease, partial [Gemmatimonadota bacterium]
MSGHDGVPRPAWWVRRVLRDRPDAPQLLAEIAELYEHRSEADGRPAAVRWLRREHRRLVWRLVRDDFEGALTSEGDDSILASIAQDVRHSTRGLTRVPLFTAAIVATVGLGIGGTTLVFSIVDSVLIAPLNMPGAERMVLLRTVDGDAMWSTSMADLHALQETPPSGFEGIAGYTYRRVRVAVEEETELLQTKFVAANYFELIGREPVRGRLFQGEEGTDGGPRVVLVTESFSERSFSPDTDPLGRSILIDGDPHEIVGVMSDDIGGLDRGIDVFPVLNIFVPPRKGPFFYPTIGRLSPDVSEEVARGQLEAVSERIFPLWSSSFPQRSAVLGFIDLKEAVVGNSRQTLWVVLSAVGFLLLIATANAASLLVARGATRHRELSVRAALGANRGRILRLLMTEAAVIATAAGAIAWLIVLVGLDLVHRLGVGRLPRIDEIGVRPSAIAFFVGITLASWLLFGVVAAIATAWTRTAGVAGTQGRASAGRGMSALRRVLVGAQFTITIPLLVGAALLLQSLDRVRSESFGFDPEGLVSVLVTLPGETYPSWSDVRDFWRETLPTVQAVPGVLSAGLADALPPQPINGGNNFLLEDRPLSEGASQPTAPWITADTHFFATLGLRPIEGRLYESTPVDTMRHAVVDEQWAERFYPGESPIGRRFRSGGCTVDGCPWTEIVGVVPDVKTSGLDDTRGMGTIYYDFARDSYSNMRLHIRAQGDPLSVVPAVRAVIQERDTGIPVGDVRTVDDVASESLAGRRYTSTLLAMLAGIALLLTVVGVYGVMAYYVQHHARDIGIRIALGGGPASALRGVLTKGMLVAVAGTVIGLAATPMLTRRMAGLLYRVEPTDPIALGAVATLTLLVAFVATYIPGRQA